MNSCFAIVFSCHAGLIPLGCYVCSILIVLGLDFGLFDHVLFISFEHMLTILWQYLSKSCIGGNRLIFSICYNLYFVLFCVFLTMVVNLLLCKLYIFMLLFQHVMFLFHGWHGFCFVNRQDETKPKHRKMVCKKFRF